MLVPWLFTSVMGHCARLHHYTGPGVDLICYLDNTIFGQHCPEVCTKHAQHPSIWLAHNTLLVTVHVIVWGV